MSNNPINLAIRFLLELAALAALGTWGFQAVQGPLRFVAAVVAPVAAAAIWGVFRIPGDPGPAPVATPGPVRLVIEIVFFSLAAIGLAAAGFSTLAWVLGGITLLHYLASYDRVARMVRNQPPNG